MATGSYDIDALYARVRGVYTHTVPVDAYRGAGRPEAAYRARAPGRRLRAQARLAPEEIARAQFRQAGADALPDPDRPPLRRRRFRGRDAGVPRQGRSRRLRARGSRTPKARGKIRGFGFASYIECTAWGEGEEGSVKLERNGDFTVLIGTQSTGQGHETAYAQMVSQTSRRAARARQGRAGRHRPDPDRQRDRRLAIDPDRRGDGQSRLADAGGFAEGACGRQARSRGRRSRDRRRQACASPAPIGRSPTPRSRRFPLRPRRS